MFRGAYSHNSQMNRGFRWYAILTVALAGGCLVSAGWRLPTENASAHWNAVAAFLVLGFLTEASYLRLRVGRTETQSSVAFISFIASVLLFDTGWAAAIAGCAVLVSEAAVKRKSPLRVAFNVAQMTVSVASASFVYQLAGGRFSLVSDGPQLNP